MNRQILLASLFCLSAIGCAKEEVKTGAYASASHSESDVKSAALFAVHAKERELGKASGRPHSLKLEKVLSSEKQVVAGLNYKLTLFVKENGRSRKAEAVVWWQAWRKPDAYQLTSWTWK